MNTAGLVYRLKPGEATWTTMPSTGLSGVAARIASNSSEKAWVVTYPSGRPDDLTNGKGSIFRLDGAAWTSVPGSAADIAVDQIGNLFVIGTLGSIFELKYGDTVWTAMP